MIAVSLLLGCGKVPLEEDFGRLTDTYLHWFENEGVAYLFFTLSDRSSRQVDPLWQLTYSYQNNDKIVTDQIELDLNLAVHRHQFTNCGKGKVCGSYSWKVPSSILQAELQFFYNRDSEINIAATISPSNHQQSNLNSSYSALFYGVFDQENEHVQIRWINNFSTPGDDTIAKFGMERSFNIHSGQLLKVPFTDFLANREASGGQQIVFPSSLCSPLLSIANQSIQTPLSSGNGLKYLSMSLMTSVNTIEQMGRALPRAPPHEHGLLAFSFEKAIL